MEDAALLLRIRAVVVSTRAAVRSLGTDQDQILDVLERGRHLLDELETDVLRYGTTDAQRQFARSRGELAAMTDEQLGSPSPGLPGDGVPPAP